MKELVEIPVPYDIARQLDLVHLSSRQRRFVLHYHKSGDALQAVQQAGYKVTKPYQARIQASRLMKNEIIRKNLELLDMNLACELIADAQECQMILTDIARDENEKTPNRLSAIKTLLTVHGSLSDKLIVEQHNSGPVSQTINFVNISPGAIGRQLGFSQPEADQDVIDIPSEDLPQDPEDTSDIPL